MIKAYKYRLYPNRKQILSLETQLSGHRFLYNQALTQRKETYEKLGEGVSYYIQAANLLPKLKKENENLAFCNYSSLQVTLRRLDQTFRAFFHRMKSEKKPGYPRFKSADRFNTISYGTIGDGCQIKDGRLYVQNVGCIKVKWHRQIEGNIKTLSVTRRNRKWYVLFIIEHEPEPLPKTGKRIGIDVGLKALLTTSDGEKVKNPKFYKEGHRKLAKVQRILSRRKKGSGRRRKARFLVAKRHEKIANQRRDFCHKVAFQFVQNYDGLAVEKLNIKGMVRDKYLSKSISDTSWGIFLNILKSKAENAGREYLEVPSQGTSQRCSSCGETVAKSLSIRVHKCPFCGLVLDRDENAARNILKLARMEPSWRGGAAMPLVEARS